MLKALKNSSALSALAQTSTKAKHSLGRFRRDEEGIAAVEFAILAPMMIALYFGLVEISLFIHADKGVSHATNIAGDLATQLSVIDAADVEDVFSAAIATLALKPEKITLLKGTLLSYEIDGSGNIAEIGKATLGGGVSDVYNPADIGPRLLTAGSGALVAQLEYQYESVTYKFVEPVTNMKEAFVLKPRVSATLPFSTDGTPKTYTCSASASSQKVSCG
jgi:Flp pilus assembly protein TadG